MLLSRFTGEDFFRKGKPKNIFDGLFLRCTGMAVLVYSIAIPFFMIDARSLPLSIGILTGLMWLPFSWIIQHWVGTFHAICRTLLIVAAWYIFPQQSFVVIPILVVIVYAISIYTLEIRWRKLSRHNT
jgi:ethanolamine transporter EutH